MNIIGSIDFLQVWLTCHVVSGHVSYERTLKTAQLIKYQSLPVEISHFLASRFIVSVHISFLRIMTTSPQAPKCNKMVFFRSDP